MSAVLLSFAEQPVIRLGVTASLCRCEIRINDIAVYADERGRAISFDMPVNEWLFRNDNEIEIRLRAAPADGMDPAEADAHPLAPRASFSLEIRHKRNHAPLRSMTPLGTIRYRHKEDGKHLFPPGLVSTPPADEPEPPGTTDPQPADSPESPEAAEAQASPGAWSFVPAVISRTSTSHQVILRSGLHLPASWPVCPWQDARPLPAPAATVYALRQLTGGVHNLLVRRDEAGLRKLLTARSRSFAAAYHLGEADLLSLTGIRERLHHPQTTVAPIPDALDAITGGHGLVAKPVDPATGLPPLRLCLPGSADLAIDLHWAMTPGWTVVA